MIDDDLNHHLLRSINNLFFFLPILVWFVTFFLSFNTLKSVVLILTTHTQNNSMPFFEKKQMFFFLLSFCKKKKIVSIQIGEQEREIERERERVRGGEEMETTRIDDWKWNQRCNHYKNSPQDLWHRWRLWSGNRPFYHQRNWILEQQQKLMLREWQTLK